MIRLSEYVSKNKFGSVRKDIPNILNMVVDRDYHLEVFRIFDGDARESVYLYTDVEITLGEVFVTFAKEWEIEEKDVHVNTVTLEAIKESAEAWNGVWEDEITLDEFIVHLSEVLPPERLEVLRKQQNLPESFYQRLEYEVPVPTSLSDGFFSELTEFLTNYNKFEDYLKHRPSTN